MQIAQFYTQMHAQTMYIWYNILTNVIKLVMGFIVVMEDSFSFVDIFCFCLYPPPEWTKMFIFRKNQLRTVYLCAFFFIGRAHLNILYHKVITIDVDGF